MDGVSWSTSRAQESFSRSKTAADTLSRLASFIARAEPKPHTRNQRQQPPHLATYDCQECGKGVSTATDLLHQQGLKNALPKPHRCPSCGQEFSLKSSLQLHKCNQDACQCERCPGESQLSSTGPWCTTSHPSSRRGEAPHCQPRLLDGSPYGCAPCGRGFSQKQALLHHQQAGCSESLSDILNANALPDDCSPVSEGDSAHSDPSDMAGPGCRAVSVCQFCSTTFRTESGLQRHNLTYHAQKGLKTKGGCSGREERNTKVKGDVIKMHKSKTKLLDCRSCDMVFRSTAKLYMHRKEKHSREKNIIEPRPVIIKRRKVGTYPCQICSKVFLHHLSLRAHYRQHTASSFSTIKSQPLGQTKDSELSENASNNVKSSIAVGKPVKAGPRRPRKGTKVENKLADRRGRREVPDEDEEREREFPCPSCAEVFSVQSRLQEHVELHQSSVKQRQCSVCTSEMDACKWPSSKRQRLYHCVPCHQGFSALDSFLEHCQEHLRLRVEEDSITEGYA
ncbi:zinc finger protein 229 isoform X1 [Pungitius pungitius]|uniref:zinc finger protein 229 isoform X1 n=1 Tax=Pungitius pungitius TaxID=134920 RepID=UPI001887104B|nr:zinc finger protein 229 isoform X1 [Pungitius pungitius]